MGKQIKQFYTSLLISLISFILVLSNKTKFELCILNSENGVSDFSLKYQELAVSPRINFGLSPYLLNEILTTVESKAFFRRLYTFQEYIEQQTKEEYAKLVGNYKRTIYLYRGVNFGVGR